MASNVTPAPTHGALLLALHVPGDCFGATDGKGLNYGAKLFIFDEATVGVDVSAKAEIYRMLGSLFEQGAELFVALSYLLKVDEPAGTLHLVRAGRLAATHGHKDASHASVLTEAIGV
jgi:ribose transport system ATP-binding protein